MLEMLMQWYRRRFSDPEAIALLIILVAGFGILFFFSGLLARCWSPLCWLICSNGRQYGWNILVVHGVGQHRLCWWCLSVFCC
ncbi:permease [Citrobacter freundii]|nr:permease [Citrobacter freundii]